MGCYPVPTQQTSSETSSSPAAPAQAPSATSASEPTTQPVEESTPPNRNRDELCLPGFSLSQCKTSLQTKRTHSHSNAIPGYVDESQKIGLPDSSSEENGTQKLPDEGYGTREQYTSSTTVSTVSSRLTLSRLQTSEWTGARKTGTHNLGISSETEELALNQREKPVSKDQQAVCLLSTSTGPHISQTHSKSLSVPYIEATDRPPPCRSRHITEHNNLTDPQDDILPTIPHRFLVSPCPPTENHNKSQDSYNGVPLAYPPHHPACSPHHPLAYPPHHPACSPYQRLAYPPHSIVVSGRDTSREGGVALTYQFGVLLLKPRERDPLYRPPDHHHFCGMAGY